MSRKLIVVSTLVLSNLITAYAIGSQTDTSLSTSQTPPVANTTNSATELTKDAWLKAMEPMLPSLICKGFLNDPELKKRFDDLKITYDQCLTLIPASQKKCQEQIYASMPDKINSEVAGVWGKTLGECIGKDFAEKYLIPKS